MHTSAFTRYKPSARHRWPRIIIALGVVLLYAAGMLISVPVTHADGIPGGNVSDPVVRAVDIAKPAVVRIFTALNSHLTVHFSATNSVTFPQNGSAYQLTLSGSGTFISGHGDILTADHVVNPPHDQQLSQFLDTVAAPDVASYINQNVRPGQPVTANQVAQELQSGQLPSNPAYDTPASQVFLSTEYSGPLSATDLSQVPVQLQAPVDRIEQQSSVNQSDVAIVHVNMSDTPAVQLGDSSGVQQQDILTILGFPGNGDVSNAPTNLLTLSVNQIFVSSIKTTDQGAQVIQVGGNVEHGDSGGPALDNQGHVVGIVSFGLSSPDSPGSTAFLQASNSARTLVQNLHLDTTPGPFEKAWSQAFNDYAASTPGHWHKAQQELGQLARSYPLFKAVAPYLAYAQAQAKNEQVSPAQKTSQTSNLATYALIMLGAVLVIGLALTFFVVSSRRRKQQKPVLPANMQPLQAQPSATIAQPGVNRPVVPPQSTVTSQPVDGMGAFGAPSTFTPPATTTTSGSLDKSGSYRAWPCGHMNRPSARFCSICGEPAPPMPPITRRVEQ